MQSYLREYFRRHGMEMIRLDTLEYINKTGFGNNMFWDGNIEKNTAFRAARVDEISIQLHVHYR